MLTVVVAHWLAFTLAGYTAACRIDPLLFFAVPATYAMVSISTRHALASGL